jgi:dTDP-4-dehydrorhamnose 3,5-epimerase
VELTRTEIPDVMLIRPHVFGDTRGYFFESWERRKFAVAGIDASSFQNNDSRSSRTFFEGCTTR